MGVSEVELESVGVSVGADRRVLLKAAECLIEDTYKLKTEPVRRRHVCCLDHVLSSCR